MDFHVKLPLNSKRMTKKMLRPPMDPRLKIPKMLEREDNEESGISVYFNGVVCKKYRPWRPKLFEILEKGRTTNGEQLYFHTTGCTYIKNVELRKNAKKILGPQKTT